MRSHLKQASAQQLVGFQASLFQNTTGVLKHDRVLQPCGQVAGHRGWSGRSFTVKTVGAADFSPCGIGNRVLNQDSLSTETQLFSVEEIFLFEFIWKILAENKDCIPTDTLGSQQNVVDNDLPPGYEFQLLAITLISRGDILGRIHHLTHSHLVWKRRLCSPRIKIILGKE